MIEPKRFQKRKEDFVCERCGYAIRGTGYTNHCPKCLWSKHVDVNPGDRAETCHGMMEPVRVEFEKGVQIICHKCVKCGVEKRKKVETGDDFNAVLSIVKKSAMEN